MRFGAGQRLMRHGQPASFVALLLEGQLDACVGGRAVRRVLPGAAVGYASLFTGGRREGDLVAAGPGYLGVISYVEIERLAASTGVGLLVRLLTRRMAAQQRSLGGGKYAAELSGELSTDQLAAPAELEDDEGEPVAQLLAAKARQNWASQSQLLMRSQAEVLYQRLKYLQIDSFSPQVAGGEE